MYLQTPISGLHITQAWGLGQTTVLKPGTEMYCSVLVPGL